MHKILLSNEIVIGQSSNLIYLEDGLVATSETQRYAKTSYEKIVEVESIPEDYEDYKYKYDEGSGFYLNENWVKPDEPINIDSILKDNELLKEKVELQEQALAELTMYISTLGV